MVAGPSLVGPGDGLLKGDQHLGLLAGDKAVREDVALQAAQVAEADPVEFQGFGDEGTKRGAHGLTLLCRMGFTGSVSGMGGDAEGERQGCHEGLKGLRLWELGFDGVSETAEEGQEDPTRPRWRQREPIQNPPLWLSSRDQTIILILIGMRL